MTIATLKNLNVHYELTESSSLQNGTADALPALVLSHSLGVDLSMWQPQMEVLASRFRVLRYDTRGHGLSYVPEGPYTIAELGRDVLELLSSLGIERFSFCGLSMGGVIGQWLGIHASARLNKLILANTGAKIGKPEIWNERMAKVEQEGIEPIIPGTLERWFTPGFRSLHPEVVSRTESLLRAANATGYIACCAAIRDADFRGEIVSIRAPTLVIGGTNDPVIPFVDAEFLAQNIPGAKLIGLEAAHLSNLEASKDFNRRLLDFLEP